MPLTMKKEKKKMNDVPVLMTLEEVERCDYAYLVYEAEDPNAHCFLRMHTYDGFISFDRPIPSRKNGMITGDVHSQPHLFKDCYEKTWFAYTAMPTKVQIASCKFKMKKNKVY